MTAPQSSIYALLDELYCVWEVDIRRRNLAFLRGIDAEYFDYLAKSGIDGLDDEKSKMRAATTLRLGFYNGIETLFLLLGAILQAPDCAYAWIAQCTTGQLRKLLRRIDDGDQSLPLKVTLEPLSWNRIAKGILVYSNSDASKAGRNGELFARLWERLAWEYTQDTNVKEYNSLKHGFRVRHGGVTLMVGAEHEYGVSPPLEEMQSIGGSEFGSTFYVLEQIGGNEKSNKSRRSRQVSVNWHAERMVLALQLISMSIRNVVSSLEILNGVKPSEVRFCRPSEDDDFDRPWEHSPGLLNMNVDLVLPEGESMKTTKQQLLDAWLREPGVAGDAAR